MEDKKTILVTGGAGFIGSELIRHLVSKTKHIVINVDKLSYSGNLLSLKSIEEQKNYPKPYELPDVQEEGGDKENKIKSSERDMLFTEAAKLVLRQNKGSIGMIQRKMSIGFNRAGRIMDELEDAGIVSAGSGSKPREVLINSEEELFMLLKSKNE